MDNEKKQAELTVVRKIDEDATLWGFPFPVFFAGVGLLLLFWLLIVSMPTLLGKTIVGIVAFLIYVIAYYIYVKTGIKQIEINIECYTRKMDCVKMEGDIIIKKINIRNIE